MIGDHLNAPSRADVVAVEDAVREGCIPRRERIATAVLAGLLASPVPLAFNGQQVHSRDQGLLALAAVTMADALIAELDK